MRSSSCARASSFVRSSSCCQRHSRGDPSAGRSTHSGCSRTRSLSSLTISGSNHSPNSRPRPLTWSTSGASPVGPDVRRDDPVAETGAVVAAAAEPAVVEHEALDADAGGRVGQRPQVVEVGLEVDRLPRVEHDGTRAASGGPGAPAGCGGGGARGRRGRRSSGRRRPSGRHTSRPGARRTSPGASSSPPPRTAWWRPAPSGSASTRCSWLPLHAVCTAQTSPWRQSKPGRAGHQQQRGVVTGAAAAARPQVRAVVEAAALRRALAAPAAGEVEHLVGAQRQRQDGAQRGDVERARCRRPRWSPRRRRAARRGRRGRAAARGVCRRASSRASRGRRRRPRT